MIEGDLGGLQELQEIVGELVALGADQATVETVVIEWVSQWLDAAIQDGQAAGATPERQLDVLRLFDVEGGSDPLALVSSLIASLRSPEHPGVPQ